MVYNHSFAKAMAKFRRNHPRTANILFLTGMSLGTLLSFALFASGTPLLGTTSTVDNLWNASSALWLMPAFFFLGGIGYRVCDILSRGRSSVKMFTSFFGIAGSLLPLILLVVWGLTGVPFNNYEPEVSNSLYLIYGAVPAITLFIFSSYLYFTIHNSKLEEEE